MSYNEEKMLILKMLEEGKITSEEAVKLLEALESGSGKQHQTESNNKQKQNGFQSEVEKVRERLYEWKKEFKTNYGNYKQKDFDRTIEDFVDKAEKLGKNVAVTTFGIVDKVVDAVGSFIDTNSFNIFGSYKLEERVYEAEAVEGTALSIEGVNGTIILKKHQDNKVIIKSKVRSPQNNADQLLKFENESGNISIKVDKAFNVSVSYEVFLPETNFKHVRLITNNGKIYAEDTIANVFEGVTKNGHIEIIGVKSNKINLNTKNARIQMSYITGREIDINTTNSVIDIKHIKTEQINAVTTNGRILAENLQDCEESPDMNINFKTTNAWIKVNMNDMDDRGYKVKAQTTNGGINLLIPQIVYNNMGKQGFTGSVVEAESAGYAGFAKKVNMNMETVNGYVEIVK